jgi:hypothetical protein
MFVKTNKMHVKLSAKKLYQADGQAVQELLKLVGLLYTPDHNSQLKDISSDWEADETADGNSSIAQMLAKVNSDLIAVKSS